VVAKPTDDGHTLNNVIPVTDKLISGSLPDYDVAFAELESMGVKTVISVDGAAPDVRLARARGMRYVHLPIGYHGLTAERQLELARALRDLPGPIYLHCHHGKHRGPAAAASAVVVLGTFSPEEGTALLKKAGTSPEHKGHFKSVAEARSADFAAIDGASNAFPEIAPMPGFVTAMAEAQTAFDHLVEIRDAGWVAPARHPDLVPLMEAGQLENLMRAMLTDLENAKYDTAFSAMMRESHGATVTFEAGLRAQRPSAELNRLLSTVGASCKSCHVAYRDVP
jgi:protein tyrosine phosphatase (PTP) superfamily phosphohydrolase (DUF442 family)